MTIPSSPTRITMSFCEWLVHPTVDARQKMSFARAHTSIPALSHRHPFIHVSLCFVELSFFIVSFVTLLLHL